MRQGIALVLISLFLLLFQSLNAEDGIPDWKAAKEKAAGYRSARQYDSAIVVLNEQIERLRDESIADSSVALLLHDLGTIHLIKYLTFRDSTDLRTAESVYQHTLVAWDTAGAAHMADKAKTLNNLAMVYDNFGLTNKALEVYEQALAVKLQVLDSLDVSLSKTYNNLAGIYDKRGETRRAYELYQKVARIRELSPNATCSDVAGAYWNVGLQARRLSLSQTARDYFGRAVAGDCPEDSLQKRIFLNGLGVVYSDLYTPDHPDYLDSARIHLDSARVLTSRVTPADYQLEIQLLANLATVSHYEGAFSEADSLLAVADSIRIAHEMDDKRYEIAYKRGRVALAKGDAEAALTHFTEARQLLQQLRTDLFISENSAVNLNMARSLRLAGQIDAAADSFYSAFHQEVVRFAPFIPLLSEAELLRAETLIRRPAEEYLATIFAQQSLTDQQVKRAGLIMLSLQGKVLAEMQARQHILATFNDGDSKRLLDSLSLLAQKITRFQLSFSSTENAEYSLEDDILDDYFAMQDRLAEQRRLRLPKQVELVVNPDDVASALPAGTGLIHYSTYASYDPNTGRATGSDYVVTVIGSDNKIDVRHLGSATEINQCADSIREHILSFHDPKTSPDIAQYETYRQLANQLSSLIWKPVASLINDFNQLIIIPGGELGNLAFAALPVSDDQFVIEKHILHYLSSARVLLQPAQENLKSKSLLVVADPFSKPSARAYGDDINSHVAQVTSEQIVSSASRQTIESCSIASIENIERLPGTRREGESVSTYWRKSFGGDAEMLVGEQARESNFRSRATGKSFIHVATHGYRLPDSCIADAESWLYGHSLPSVPSMYLSSGLILAPESDSRSVSCDTCQDGILSALEILTLKLGGTESVVLSACNSGRGVIESREGTYGLRRAFQLAGARTVVSALWPVNDQFTPVMMQAYYLDPEASTPERLRTSQLNAIALLRKLDLPPHPYLWAPFVAYGRWWN